jgi:7,8-dihydropterin-6-yl-methyl-4-(beta-D-ribofuranosyl)aminobenzene 5'-phosphate synthase
MTTGEIPMVSAFEHIDSGLFVKEGSTWKPDKVMDDQALIVKTKQGLAVILGCAHRGIINPLYHAQHIAPSAEIYAVIGGYHCPSILTDARWRPEERTIQWCLSIRV